VHVIDAWSLQDSPVLYDHLYADGSYGPYLAQFDKIRYGKESASPYDYGRVVRRIENRVPNRNMVEIGGGAGVLGVIAVHHAGIT